ncbi:thyroglobulin type-1 repeat family protein [Aphelenchoides avenae]|nr:thyroglobulin type-1 repeat family protein [Aphelenchus avenae]
MRCAADEDISQRLLVLRTLIYEGLPLSKSVYETEPAGLSIPQKKSSASSDTEDPRDCRSHRNRILERHSKSVDKGFYVPTCTGNNDRFYEEVQCHRETQYCWCVKRDSGEPLSGTSIRGVRPNCKSQPSSVQRQTSIKGCPPEKQRKFFRRLFSSLEMEARMSANTASPIGNSMHEARERAANWKFFSMDENNNGVIDRREWKPFRQTIRKWDQVRKCGRNFIRFCDADLNRRITLDEWKQCTLAAYDQSRAPPTTGKNPFLYILKADGY